MTSVTDDQVSASELDVSSMQLGVDDLEFAMRTREHVRNMALSLATQARQELLLYTMDLEPEIFDQQPFLDAVSRLARQHSEAHVWILIENSRKAVQQGHRLIELSRRLSSHIHFRRPAPRYLDYGKAFLLCDNTGYSHRPLASRYEGTANFNNPGQTVSLKKYFMEVWDQSQPDEEMRRLYL